MPDERSESTKNKQRGKSFPTILFDLDGTLVDSNYEHVAAWREALGRDAGQFPNARIHRLIGMSGSLLVEALYRELGRTVSPKQVDRLEKMHKTCFARRLSTIGLLPGAKKLLNHLSAINVPWAIATSGDKKTVSAMIGPLRVPKSAPVITGDDVEHAKPDPNVFLLAAERLGVELSDCIVVGDSVWDVLAARRAKALGVGLLCGGYANSELEQAGAYRVYRDPEHLLAHIAEIGIRTRG